MRLKALEIMRTDDIPNACTQCGHCNASCPTGNELRWELGSPRGKIFFTKWLRDHGSKIPKEFLDRIFQCTMCGRCHTECQADLETIELWKSIRAEIGMRGMWPEQIRRLVDNVRRTKNVYGRPNNERVNWTSHMPEKVKSRINKPANVCYFVGCLSSYSRRLSGIPDSMIKILEAAKVNYTILGHDEWCSGTPLHFSGEYNTALELAEHNTWKFEGLGIDTIVAPCAGCYRALKLEYPKLVGSPMSFRVLHSSEFILELINGGKLKPTQAVNRTVAYHDPCMLGRHCGVYEPPREVLKKLPGAKPMDFIESRDKSKCSGAGGNMKGTFPRLALDIAAKLIKEASELKADTIASACPTTKLNILKSLEENNSSIKMMDIVELVAESIPEPTAVPTQAVPAAASKA